MDQFDDLEAEKTGWKYVKDAVAQWNCIGGELAITLWAASFCLIIATLMVGHWVTLPHPEVGDRFQTLEVGLHSVTTASSPDKAFAPSGDKVSAVFAYHFLYADCPCSRRVLRHMLKRTPLAGATESIVLIGDTNVEQSNAIQAASLGYQVDVVAPQELKTKYGVESAPLMVVTNREQQIVYSGGYTTRKQGPDIQEAAIISAIVAGKEVDSLPVFGCGVSKELQAMLDPLRLKYAVE